MIITELDQMIEYNQKINAILTELYILDEELKFNKLSKNQLLYTQTYEKIKEKYRIIKNIQLQTMELRYSVDDFKTIFYRDQIFSVNELIRYKENSIDIFFPVIINNLYSSVNKQSNIPISLDYKIQIPASLNITTIIHLADDNFETEELIKKLNQTNLKFKNHTYYTECKDNNKLEMITNVVNLMEELLNKNEVIYFFSTQNELFSNIILVCFLLKIKFYSGLGAIKYANFLRDLSIENQSEITFNNDEIELIFSYSDYIGSK
jgi:hypothetical protein